MNIVSTQFTLENKSLDIYLSGCSGQPKCIGCHNPELWDFDNGKPYKEWISFIQRKIKDFDLLIENIMIFGGEPLDQDHEELVNLLIELKKTNKKIWIFTRYELYEIPEVIKGYCHYIKTGRYNTELLVGDNIQYGIKLASSNQKIWNLKEN